MSAGMQNQHWGFYQPELQFCWQFAHQGKVIFCAAIGFAGLGEDGNGQSPGQENDQSLETMDVILPFV